MRNENPPDDHAAAEIHTEPRLQRLPTRKSRQPASSFCLAAANSSSLNTPAVCNCASCWSWAVRSGPAAAAAGAGGGGGGGGTDQLRSKYRKEHFEYIRRIIQENIVYPDRAQRNGWEGQVVVMFSVMQNGRVKDIRIRKSCGYGILDENVEGLPSDGDIQINRSLDSEFETNPDIVYLWRCDLYDVELEESPLCVVCDRYKPASADFILPRPSSGCEARTAPRWSR